MEFILEPMKDKNNSTHYDYVLLRTPDGEPQALLYIDAFHRSSPEHEESRHLYRALNQGETKRITVTWD